MNDLNQNNAGVYDWSLFRRDVRRDVRNCALFLFFFYVVNIIATVAAELIILMNNSSFLSLISDPDFLMGMVSGELSASDQQAYTDALMVMQDGFALGLVSIVGIVLGSLVFLIYRKRKFFTDLALSAAERMTPVIFVILLIATQGFQYVYGLLTTLIDSLLPAGMSIEQSYSSVMEGLYSPMGLVYIILVGPIFEELIFRGAIFGALRRYGENFGILFSSLFFGLYHMLILQIPFAFVMGLLLGYVASRWSIRYAILLHILVNGLSVLFSLPGNDVLPAFGGVFMLICAVITIIFLIVRRKRVLTRIRIGAAYYPHTYANGFSSIAFWVFAIIMVSVGLLQVMGLLGI